MTISLQKGETIALKKNDNKLKKIKVCLGWDAKKKDNSLISFLTNDFWGFSSESKEYDLDASAFLLSNNRIKETIYYAHLCNFSKTVVHSGDNLTGEGKDLDKEQITVNLQKLPSDINGIYFAVNIFRAEERNQDFSKIKNAFIRIVNMDNEEEFCKYELSGKNYDGNEAMLFGILKKENNEWNFEACGDEIKYGSTISDVKRQILNKLNN
jgi:stress response protein SCP2